MSTRSCAWILFEDTFECFLTEQQVRGGKEQGRNRVVHSILCILTRHYMTSTALCVGRVVKSLQLVNCPVEGVGMRG